MSEYQKKGILYLVPTPIGNLEDITLRALRILKEVDLIASEDTRNTQKLLNHFEIKTPQISYHQHNEKMRSEEIIQKLLNGMTIAQVSDAGMPSISDPGVVLVQLAIEHHIQVIPLPGANAALTALIASGIAPQPFIFYGFLPSKNKDRKETLKALANKEETIILYESPHALKNFLKEAMHYFTPNRQIVLAREVTKRYEEFIRGSFQEIVSWAEMTDIRGEFVIIIAGNEMPIVADEEWKYWTIKEHIQYIMKEQNIRSKEAIKQVAKLRNIKTNEVYAIYHGLS
ncbi:16S rRNA (cytidine(1402)-2'-O)-methyltransferase [Allofustis seminis]|uniref:16S rRNA (cytidine(1402)-2'-O)-methyltransferase n=1 Tax=Allofustis seminis TaxID=166939 RepID=UPI000360EE67|nr:16S rRNA (cytidine(1402)-2'-O)-methyltransferase [Allofustis seminis]